MRGFSVGLSVRSLGTGRAAAALLGLAAGAASAAADAGPAAGTGPGGGEVAAGLAAPVRVGADGIAEVLPGAVAGDAGNGRAIVANRQVGLCLLCHAGPIPEERFQGNLAPDLTGAGDRSTAAQL